MGFRLQGLGFGVEVWSLGVRVLGLGFWVLGLGFRVLDFVAAKGQANIHQRDTRKYTCTESEPGSEHGDGRRIAYRGYVCHRKENAEKVPE